jgi:hypothetical protein
MNDEEQKTVSDTVTDTVGVGAANTGIVEIVEMLGLSTA